MRFNSDARHRRSVRLRAHDYAGSGAYFVTICTVDRASLFGEIVEGRVALTDVGDIVREEWVRSAALRRELRLDAFVVMPNHIHGIVWIVDEPVGAHGRAPRSRDDDNDLVMNQRSRWCDVEDDRGLDVCAGTRHADVGQTDSTVDEHHMDIAGSRKIAWAHSRAPLHADDGDRSTNLRLPRRAPRSLGAFVAGFKAAATTQINRYRHTPGDPVWQRSYYDHVVRTEDDLSRTRQYIVDNPSRWDSDRENPLAHVSLTPGPERAEPWHV